jgi:hypothetical protein
LVYLRSFSFGPKPKHPQFKRGATIHQEGITENSPSIIGSGNVVINSSPSAPHPIALVIKTFEGFLPIQIPIDSWLYLLPITLNHGQGETMPLISFGNHSDKRLSWPYSWKGKIKAGQNALRYDFQNLGETAVLNVLVKFKVNFINATRKGEIMPQDTFAFQSRTVSIGALDKGATFSFWIANESKFGLEIWRPDTAELQVPGESMRRSVRLSESGINVIDALPLTFLSPSVIDWTHTE